MTTPMLRPEGVYVPDRPACLFQYGITAHEEIARGVEPYLAMGMTDREAWAGLFRDEDRIKRFKSVWGNRK